MIYLFHFESEFQSFFRHCKNKYVKSKSQDCDKGIEICNFTRSKKAYKFEYIGTMIKKIDTSPTIRARKYAFKIELAGISTHAELASS